MFSPASDYPSAALLGPCPLDSPMPTYLGQTLGFIFTSSVRAAPKVDAQSHRVHDSPVGQNQLWCLLNYQDFYLYSIYIQFKDAPDSLLSYHLSDAFLNISSIYISVCIYIHTYIFYIYI